MNGFKITDEKKEYSVTRTLRIKKELLNRLEKVAYKHDISTNKLIIKCIEYVLDNLEEDTEK